MSNAQVTYVPRNYNRVSDSEIAAAKARRIEEVVGAVLPLNRGGFALCPFHDERSPSFHVNPKLNRFICFGCGARGDVIEFVQRTQALGFFAAVRELAGGVSGPRYVPAQKPEAVQRAETPPCAVIGLWNSAASPELARYYLDSRGLRLGALPDALRGHKAVWCAETREHRPAMLAAITAADGTITAIQRTWIKTLIVYEAGVGPAKGARATDLSASKKTWGPMGSGAVRLFMPGPILGLAEGVESAIAAAKLFHLPVWATCGTARLGKIELPADVERIVIFGDNGAAGEAAAAKAETDYQRRGYAAQVELPDPSYGDFAEQVSGR